MRVHVVCMYVCIYKLLLFYRIVYSLVLTCLLDTLFVYRYTVYRIGMGQKDIKVFRKFMVKQCRNITFMDGEI